MRNPALLAAELSGRPLLLREGSVLPYARLLGVATDGSAKGGLSGLLGRARRLLSSEGAPAPAPSQPLAYAPSWLGGPDHVGLGWVLRSGVGLVDISGPLMAHGFGWDDCWYHGYDTLRVAFEEMFADARVGAVMVRIASPGGVAAPGLPELATLIRAGRAGGGGKPVWAYCDYAYSAAYWIAAQCDQVVAPREGGVGSIGCVVTHCDMSGMLEQDGITVTPIKFGKKKTDGSPYEPLSATAAADIQAEVDQVGRWFVQDVIAGRPSLSEATILATEAGCFLGDSDEPSLSGLAIGLTDAVMSERETFDALVALAAGETSDGPLVDPSPTPETDMKRSNLLAAASAIGLSAAQVASLNTELDKIAASDEAGDAGETEAEDDAEAGDPARTPADEDEDEKGDEEEPPKPEASAVLAIVGLPEAKGREKLAQTLAGTPGMTVAAAKAALAAAPKGSALAERMQGRDPQLSAGGDPVVQGDFAEGKALGERYRAMNTPKKRVA